MSIYECNASVFAFFFFAITNKQVPSEFHNNLFGPAAEETLYLKALRSLWLFDWGFRLEWAVLDFIHLIYYDIPSRCK